MADCRITYRETGGRDAANPYLSCLLVLNQPVIDIEGCSPPARPAYLICLKWDILGKSLRGKPGDDFPIIPCQQDPGMIHIVDHILIDHQPALGYRNIVHRHVCGDDQAVPGIIQSSPASPEDQNGENQTDHNNHGKCIPEYHSAFYRHSFHQGSFIT